MDPNACTAHPEHWQAEAGPLLEAASLCRGQVCQISQLEVAQGRTRGSAGKEGRSVGAWLPESCPLFLVPSKW